MNEIEQNEVMGSLMFKTALFPTNHSNGGNVEQTFSDNSAEFSKIFWYFPVLDNI